VVTKVYKCSVSNYGGDLIRLKASKVRPYNHQWYKWSHVILLDHHFAYYYNGQISGSILIYK